jgi:2'-5' RNA ligase
MPDHEAGMNSRGDGKTRVFFALWPDAAAAASLHAIAEQWHRSLGGRVTREDSLHATLVFIGDIALDRLPSLLALAEGIQTPTFAIEFDSGGCWKHNHIAYLGMHRISDALQSMQSELASRVRAAGFNVDQRRYSPHVTLIRKAVCANAIPEKENPAEPVAWTVRDFVLVKSSMSANGSRYEQIGCWPLLQDDSTS